MCVCMENARQGYTGRRKLLGLRGTLFLVSVIGHCLVVLFLGIFDTQTDVHMCKKNARHGNTGQKKIAWAEGNPPLGLCDWTLSCFTFSL